MAKPIQERSAPHRNIEATEPVERSTLRTTADLLPRVLRENITWRNVGSNVEIRIDVSHVGAERSIPAQLIVEAAPLGAFISARRIAKIPVPALDPGGRRRLTISVARDALPSLAEFNRELVARLYRYSERTGVKREFGLEVDLLSSAEWAGNLNLWFDVRPKESVELHRALDLKVGAGRTAAIGLFLPPAGDPDYETEVVHNGAGWTVRIVEIHERVSILVVRAPLKAGALAKVGVLVTRVADRYIVPVDFSFESVEGPSEGLGCIPI